MARPLYNQGPRCPDCGAFRLTPDRCERCQERISLLEHGLKKCSKCKEIKQLTEFTRERSMRRLAGAHCRSCHSKTQQEYYATEKGKATILRHKEKRKRNWPVFLAWDRNRTLMRHFGLSLDEYNRMKKKQDGLCAICGNPPQKKDLSVDHDHTTGKIRALLCGICNRGLGQFKDDPVILIKAARYLLLFAAKELAGNKEVA